MTTIFYFTTIFWHVYKNVQIDKNYNQWSNPIWKKKRCTPFSLEGARVLKVSPLYSEGADANFCGDKKNRLFPRFKIYGFFQFWLLSARNLLKSLKPLQCSSKCSLASPPHLNKAVNGKWLYRHVDLFTSWVTSGKTDDWQVLYPIRSWK